MNLSVYLSIKETQDDEKEQQQQEKAYDQRALHVRFHPLPSKKTALPRFPGRFGASYHRRGGPDKVNKSRCAAVSIHVKSRTPLHLMSMIKD